MNWLITQKLNKWHWLGFSNSAHAAHHFTYYRLLRWLGKCQEIVIWTLCRTLVDIGLKPIGASKLLIISWNGMSCNMSQSMDYTYLPFVFHWFVVKHQLHCAMQADHVSLFLYGWMLCCLVLIIFRSSDLTSWSRKWSSESMAANPSRWTNMILVRCDNQLLSMCHHWNHNCLRCQSLEIHLLMLLDKSY